MVIYQKNSNRRLEIALHIVIWIFFLGGFVYTFVDYLPLQDNFIRAVINVIPLIALFYFNVWLVNRYWERKKYGQFVLYCFLSLLVVSLFRGGVNITFEYVGINESKSKLWWFFTSMILNFFLMIIAVLYELLHNRVQSEKRNLKIINEQQEAQLQSLRAQINPHFLFNTLNNIYALTMVDPKQTAQMVLKLSNLLRYVIYDGQEKQVSLKKDIRQIEEFIALFQMRMEAPADIQFNHSGATEAFLIEPMILIPFFENSFKHGDFDSNPNAYLKADLTIEHHTLNFKIINSKNDQNRQKDAQGGVGLSNIQKRLELKYKGKYELRIDNREHEFGVYLKFELTYQR